MYVRVSEWKLDSGHTAWIKIAGKLFKWELHCSLRLLWNAYGLLSTANGISYLYFIFMKISQYHNICTTFVFHVSKLGFAF